MRTSIQFLPLIFAILILQAVSSCFPRSKTEKAVPPTETPAVSQPGSVPSPPGDYPVAPEVAIFSELVDQFAYPPGPTSFQKEFNPTGNPVGGGPGYSPITNPGADGILVNTADQLIRALGTARNGDVIFIPGTVVIDLSGRQLKIPGGVTLASDRGLNGSAGALLYSNTVYNEKSVNNLDDYLFCTGGKNVKVTGLRLKGPSGEIFEFTDGTACGIKGRHGYLEVSNCELSHWLKWAIDLAYARADHIHHNHIHHTRRLGYGYGVWVRGTESDPAPPHNEVALIEANIFEACRHEIAAGGQRTSSYIARYNLIDLHSMPNHNIDRHQQGLYTEVRNNVIASISHYNFHGMREAPLDKVIFSGNWCDLEQMEQVFPYYKKPGWNIDATGNHLGGSWRSNQPSVQLQASATEGTAPLTVQFIASGDDPAQYPINAFVWDWKDGRDFMMLPYSQMELTFKEPGIYHVRVRARNAYGLLSEPVGLKIHVRDAGNENNGVLNQRLLAFWEFDDPSDVLKDANGNFPLQFQEGEPELIKGMIGNAFFRSAPADQPNQTLGIPARYAGVFQPGNSDFSAMVAFRVREAPEKNIYTGIFGYGAGNGTQAGYNLVLQQKGKLSLMAFFSNGMGERQQIIADGEIVLGKWHVAVISFDRDGKCLFYVDGKPSAEKDLLMGQDHIYHEHLDFGIFQRFSRYSNADVDFAAVWDRALSPAEALWLCNGGNGRSYEELRDFMP